jgi:hypothetical protein
LLLMAGFEKNEKIKYTCKIYQPRLLSSTMSYGARTGTFEPVGVDSTI